MTKSNQNDHLPKPHKTDARITLTPKGTGFALFLSTLWGGNAVALKAGLVDAPPLRIASMRFLLGGIVTIIWAIWTKQKVVPNKKDIKPLLGLIAIFIPQIALMNLGQNLTSASHAVIIAATFPIWTGVIAHFTVPGDKLSVLRILGTCVAYIGIVVVFMQDFSGSESTLFGDFLYLGSAILLGLGQVYRSNTLQHVDLAKVLMTQQVIGILAFFSLGLIFESNPWVITERLIYSVIYQGGVIAGFGFIGNLWLLQKYRPSGVAAISMTTPIWGVILANLVLNEPLQAMLFLGLALVIAGLSLSHWSTNRSVLKT
ncbi:MAG: hypothetical protein CL752_01175 [Chloroflexi bacterium]|nr:hypothetical protein [Chloroflexota bacterium]|tara:strand:+ start:22335 stop:23279 length:945 start_codon:yes stop_codon:yes gene_type:complete